MFVTLYMAVALDIKTFLEKSSHVKMIDVRTPAEFEQGHIPHAINIPLFTNEERAVIGTIYKQEGNGTAIRKGLEFVGPKMINLVSSIQSHTVNNEILIHCWRGGMRSGSVAWLMELNGIKASTLKGGYKSFRAAMRNTFALQHPLCVIGGPTGSGKSKILRLLEKTGETIIDLEEMANHKGSSFGHLGEQKPPTQETFENRLGWLLYNTQNKKTIWIEDESRMIGTKAVPVEFYNQMLNANTFVLDIPFDIRAAYLTTEYGKYDKQSLIEATVRIKKRIGPEQCKNAVAFIESGNLLEACKISLQYYDKTYAYGVTQRKPETVKYLKFEKLDFEQMAASLIKQRN